MDYTSSPGNVDDGEGKRSHSDTNPIPTDVSANDMNMVIWSLMEVVKDGDEAPIAFDKENPGTYRKLVNAITKLGRQATEDILGYAKLATQSQTDAGTNDATIVTPKKLRWGFSISISQTGYIVFPSWLGGLILQWGSGAPNSSGENYTLPLTFPNAFLRVVATVDDSAFTDFYARITNNNSVFLRSSNGGYTIAYIAIGH